MTNRLIFLILSWWLGATVLIDFVIVPTVFQTIDSFFNAGELGIALFRKFNFVECMFAVCLVLLSLKRGKKFTYFKLHSSLVALVCLIVLTYVTYLTPYLAKLTGLWKEADTTNTIAIAGISDIQQEHQFFHRIYVTLDTFKILFLASLFTLEFRFSEVAGGKA